MVTDGLDVVVLDDLSTGDPRRVSEAPLVVGSIRDPTGFRARQLSPAMVDDADLVLALSTGHRTRVLEQSPLAMRRTFTLREAATLLTMPASATELLPAWPRPAPPSQSPPTPSTSPTPWAGIRRCSGRSASRWLIDPAACPRRAARRAGPGRVIRAGALLVRASQTAAPRPTARGTHGQTGPLDCSCCASPRPSPGGEGSSLGVDRGGWDEPGVPVVADERFPLSFVDVPVVEPA